MMIHTAIGGAIAAIAAVCPSCDSPTQPAPSPPRVLYVPEEYPYRWDARPGDTLILIMNPDGHQLDRCNDAGGELIEYRENMLWYCEDADF